MGLNFIFPSFKSFKQGRLSISDSSEGNCYDAWGFNENPVGKLAGQPASIGIGFYWIALVKNRFERVIFKAIIINSMDQRKIGSAIAGRF